MQANNELQLLKEWKPLHVHFYMEKRTKASENDYDMKKPRIQAEGILWGMKTVFQSLREYAIQKRHTNYN